MAKRFTDSDKWKNPNFRGLSGPNRWLWLYILDTCDNAGIWRVDFDLASYCIGERIDPREALETFKDKIVVIDHDKWFVPSFIEFQYGELREASKPHQSVIKNLLKHGINPHSLRPIKEYPKGIDTLKDKDKDKEKNKEKENVINLHSKSSLSDSQKQDNRFKFNLQALYEIYPRQQKKALSLSKLAETVTTQEIYDQMYRAFLAYKAYVEREKIPFSKILLLVNFLNEWTDWLDPLTGQSQSGISNKPYNPYKGLANV